MNKLFEYLMRFEKTPVAVSGEMESMFVRMSIKKDSKKATILGAN